MRRYSGSSEAADFTSKSLGEGSCLVYVYVYLHQSKILLYKCVSSAMVAFISNGKGDIVGNFEFLPNAIKSELIDETDCDSFSGPYTTNRIELGTDQGDSTFY